jgi:ABC-type branched-subunit amino acid transport system substrate-binding protein
MVRNLLLLLIITCYCLVNAQEMRDAESRFKQALFLYQSSQYEPALKYFTELAAENNQYRVQSEIFMGKIFLHQGRINEAEEKFKELKANVKDDVYLREILLNNSIVLHKKGMDYESARELLVLIDIAPGTQHARYAAEALDSLALFSLSSDDMIKLQMFAREETKPLLLLLLGKAYLVEGKRKEAKEAFLRVIKEYPSSAQRKEAEEYYNDRKSIKVPEKGDPVIVVLFPMEPGNTARPITQISEGVKYAVHEFNTGREDKIGIVFINMEADNIKEIKSSILGMNAKSVIGPVYSDDVRLVLAEFRGIKLPLISPTATDNDLTSMNEFFFQANPNFSVRARAMAQYIYYVENKRRMAVLNAIEGYSPLLASEFSQEFRKLGGEVVINRTYKSRSGAVDSPASEIIAASDRIEGIYVPVSDRDDIPPLLNALAKSDSIKPIYGNQDWFLGKGYEVYPLLINNLIFTSDYYVDFSSYSYNSFNEEFISRTGMEADRNVLYGYDLANYFLNQMTKIYADPDVIASRMMNGNTVNGFHNNISFDEERVNKFINIVRYREGLFELLDKFRTSK